MNCSSGYYTVVATIAFICYGLYYMWNPFERKNTAPSLEQYIVDVPPLGADILRAVQVSILEPAYSVRARKYNLALEETQVDRIFLAWYTHRLIRARDELSTAAFVIDCSHAEVSIISDSGLPKIEAANRWICDYLSMNNEGINFDDTAQEAIITTTPYCDTFRIVQ